MSSPRTPDRALQAALARLDRALVTSPDDVRLLVLRGRASHRAEQHDDAAQFYGRAARAARAEGDRRQEAECRLEVARSLARSGSDAQVAFQRAISCYELFGGGAATVEARLEFAEYRMGRGESGAARQQLERVLEPLESLDDAERLGWVHDRLAHVVAEFDPEQALNHARAAVQWTAKAGARAHFGMRLAHMGTLHQQVGNASKARGYWDRAIPHLERAATRAGDGPGATDNWWQLALLHHHLERPDAALTALAACEAVYRRSRRPTEADTVASAIDAARAGRWNP